MIAHVRSAVCATIGGLGGGVEPCSGSCICNLCAKDNMGGTPPPKKKEKERKKTENMVEVRVYPLIHFMLIKVDFF